MVAQRASRDKPELLFHSKLGALNAAWAHYLHKLGTPCAQLEKLQDFPSIAFNMRTQSLGKKLSERRRKLTRIPQWI